MERFQLVGQLLERLELERFQLVGQLVERLQLVGQLVERLELVGQLVERLELVGRAVARRQLGTLSGRNGLKGAGEPLAGPFLVRREPRWPARISPFRDPPRV